MRKLLTLLFFISLSHFAFGQPDPAWFYPEKIEKITEQLKTDSLNYDLIWERLGMKVALLMRDKGNEQFNDVFRHYPNVITCEKIDCKEYNEDFEMIYDNAFISKKIQLNPFDFYLLRMLFYGSTLQLDKAYEDLIYIKRNIPVSKDWETEIEFYFFKIYALKKDYDKALETINSILETEKNKFYAYNDPNNKYRQKVDLFKYFNKTNKLIAFLKQHCGDSFDLYFRSKNEKDNDRAELKENSFVYLTELIYYMKEYNYNELPKYEKIYKQLRYQMNENYETINPNINDSKLKSIVSQIK
ncbi:hypothetical protein EG240_10735 [Paenimyroides tangerinum]|uniref:Tetratricopeptide repeat protein n=1 Tax=Paenimyroides tangerinum TaxID=2488728 RepID=A0A3P3W5B0_9FLAO|nr:hypothetical protein [Paenimyroides tangerinum]RRJ89864.1 hypothetical protein EG240_10735 [Paenimyroides tangerinum]